MPLLAEIAAKEGTRIKKPPITTTPVSTKQADSVESRLNALEEKDVATILPQKTMTDAQNVAAAEVARQKAEREAQILADAQAQAWKNRMPDISGTSDLSQGQQFISPNIQRDINGMPVNLNAGADQLAQYGTPSVLPAGGVKTQSTGTGVAQPTGGVPTKPLVEKPRLVEQRGSTDGTGVQTDLQLRKQEIKDSVTPDLLPDGTKPTPSKGGAPTGDKTTTTTTTGATPEGEDTTNQTSMQLLKEIQTDQFTYDSNADEQYKIAASNLENEVANMMVGRGGLYSSVASSALQNRLIALQVQFRQTAYDEFLKERSFKMDMAKFLADREDASFSKEMALANYNLNVQQQQFSQWMQKQNHALQQAQFSFAKQRAALESESEQKRLALNTSIASWQNQDQLFTKMLNKWKNAEGGVASPDVASYFGVQNYSQFGKNGYAINMKKASLERQQQLITQQAVDINAADVVANALNGWYAESTKTYDVNNDPVIQLGLPKQVDTYNKYSAFIETQFEQNVKTPAQIVSDLQKNYAQYINEMGSMLYQRLLNKYEARANMSATELIKARTEMGSYNN